MWSMAYESHHYPLLMSWASPDTRTNTEHDPLWEILPLPASTPTSISPATSDQPQNEKQHDRSNERIDDQGNDSHTEMDM
jgi:hypothetical protein